MLPCSRSTRSQVRFGEERQIVRRGLGLGAFARRRRRGGFFLEGCEELVCLLHLGLHFGILLEQVGR